MCVHMVCVYSIRMSTQIPFPPEVLMKVRLSRTDEANIVRPASLQQAIDSAVSKIDESCTFMRPSGTEAVLRMYAEDPEKHGGIDERGRGGTHESREGPWNEIKC
eukprot:GHVU01096296.1.p3 GENE.GHVU01096296.1~~GHVU01096296.1.p3  ORF type:complete len:105 (-),score=15.17 GHVU01096296.1:371-685(-)